MELKWFGGIQPLDIVITCVVSDRKTAQPVNVDSIGALSSLAQPRPISLIVHLVWKVAPTSVSVL